MIKICLQRSSLVDTQTWHNSALPHERRKFEEKLRQFEYASDVIEHLCWKGLGIIFLFDVLVILASGPTEI